MGLQDRDYYREKHRQSTQVRRSDNWNRQRYRQPAQGRGSLRQLLMPVLAILVLWYGADRFLKHRTSRQSVSPSTEIPADADANQPVSGGLVIKADRQGHFRGTVSINDVPMPFLIDTGATRTSVPARLASAAGLPFGPTIQTSTAGGEIVDRMTQISHLQIGNAHIRNLEANINQHLEMVLIGMNTLKLFDITQSGDTMTLVANGGTPQPLVEAPVPLPPGALVIEQPAEQALPIQPAKRPTAIKKTVSCDANHVCTTKYSDR